MKNPQEGTDMLPVVLEHTRHDLNRADLTALGSVGALIALGTMITQINQLPAAVLPWLATATIPATGVLAAACWAMWPRGINTPNAGAGSWIHARAVGCSDLVDDYNAHSATAIAAAQLWALANVAHRKFTAVRVMLPLLGATVALLLVALMVGLLH